jgi:cell wall assembly regulator SMI1
MKVFKTENPGSQLAHDEIEDFEASIGTRLPEDYRKFLAFTNGGAPAEGQSWMKLKRGWVGSNWICIDFFYGLSRPDVRAYELPHIWSVFKVRLPTDFLPIATDSYGNQLLIDLRRTKKGSVYFWNHEREVAPVFVSPSFSAFYAQLQLEPD